MEFRSMLAAEAGKVSASPTVDGMPALATIEKLTGWAMQFGLMACLFFFVIGGALWAAGSHAGNGMQAGRGKDVVTGAVIGAILIGCAAAVINGVYTASSTPAAVQQSK